MVPSCATTARNASCRPLRFPVSRLLGLLAARESRDSILSAYPYLEEADIDEALRYATRGRMVVPQDIEAAYREMAKDERRIWPRLGDVGIEQRDVKRQLHNGYVRRSWYEERRL